MQKKILNFLKKLSFLSIIIGLISFIIIYLFPNFPVTPKLPYIILFFFVITLIIFYILLKSFEKKPKRFISYFMASTVIKLLLYIVIIATYIFTHKEDAIAFTIAFLVLYVIYTSFEVISISKYSKNKFQKK